MVILVRSLRSQSIYILMVSKKWTTKGLIRMQRQNESREQLKFLSDDRTVKIAALKKDFE